MQDRRILRQIILDAKGCRFFMLVARFWCYVFRHPEYFTQCIFDKERKPLLRVLREVWISWRYWGMFPFDYFGCKVYRMKPEHTIQEVLEYVPQYFFDHVHIPSQNDRLYSLNLTNKILLDKLLASRGIPRPRTLCTLEGGRAFDNCGGGIDYNKFVSMASKVKRTIFIKPAFGRGGEGIRVFERGNDGVFRTQAGRELDLELLETMGEDDDYIVQEGLNQIDVLNQIFPHSINTIRIPSIVKDGTLYPVAAILRIGRGENRVDNSAQGGISVEIDTDTWRLKGRGYSEHPVGSYEHHPDSGVSFCQQLPMKREVYELLSKAASVFPKCHIFGWDVALTPLGPVVIEVNPGFGLNHVQITCQRGIRKDLGIVR